jgi:hypothetical protein
MIIKTGVNKKRELKAAQDFVWPKKRYWDISLEWMVLN